LLDSIVKNVGTPYTLFLGRHLYGTFMEAYALADNGVRQRMEVMLKTWKKPVPGSIDTRPVFPPEVTGPIENALIKARTSAMEAHQQYSRSQPPGVRPRPGSAAAYRDTPTPPNGARQATPSSQQFLNPPNSFGTVPQYPPQQSHHPQQYLQQPVSLGAWNFRGQC
jgi:pre-mRNA cleavage complex 2 protein Pcf11